MLYIKSPDFIHPVTASLPPLPNIAHFPCYQPLIATLLLLLFVQRFWIPRVSELMQYSVPTLSHLNSRSVVSKLSLRVYCSLGQIMPTHST